MIYARLKITYCKNHIFLYANNGINQIRHKDTTSDWHHRSVVKKNTQNYTKKMHFCKSYIRTITRRFNLWRNFWLIFSQLHKKTSKNTWSPINRAMERRKRKRGQQLTTINNNCERERVVNHTAKQIVRATREKKNNK